jgi:CRISPR-associated protein Csb2
VIEAADDEGSGERTAPNVYVPPNDAAGDRLDVLPDRRKRQARTFRAVTPAGPIIRFHWDVGTQSQHMAVLDALARQVASLGHSASLVRFQFTDGEHDIELSRIWTPADDGTVSLRAPYSGRLVDLERWYRAGQRPQSRHSVSYRPPPRAESAASVVESVFGTPNDWFVFEDAGGFRPDLTAIAHVSRQLRHALMSVSRHPVPEVMSGHEPDGRPSMRPHVAIVPLANLGWEWSTGELLGVAVVLPRSLPRDERQGIIESLARFVQFRGDVAQALLRLRGARQWVLERSAAPSRASVAPQRWCGEARIWASATPMLLDRFPDDPVEEATSVAAACRHIGLPEPSEIEIHKHSAVGGAPSAYGRGTDWSFPVGSKLSQRIRRHVVLRFAEKVRGPVLIGAGRYQGLGLCLPIDSEDRP